jgi:hypothetical protein
MTGKKNGEVSSFHIERHQNGNMKIRDKKSILITMEKRGKSPLFLSLTKSVLAGSD